MKEGRNKERKKERKSHQNIQHKGLEKNANLNYTTTEQRAKNPEFRSLHPKKTLSLTK